MREIKDGPVAALQVGKWLLWRPLAGPRHTASGESQCVLACKWCLEPPVAAVLKQARNKRMGGIRHSDLPAVLPVLPLSSTKGQPANGASEAEELAAANGVSLKRAHD